MLHDVNLLLLLLKDYPQVSCKERADMHNAFNRSRRLAVLYSGKPRILLEHQSWTATITAILAPSERQGPQKDPRSLPPQ